MSLLICTGLIAQTTEGNDFWVTFLQSDQDDNNSLQLQLSISSRSDCQVTITNPFTNYSETVPVTAGVMKLVELYSGNVLAGNARSSMQTSGKVCYAVNSEKVDTCALHVTATANISLFATNYKKATFDATNVIPTASLLDEYLIQTYTPSDHAGTGATQGSHFAVIATEDNTVIDYCPSEKTKAISDAQAIIDFSNDSTLLSAEQLNLLRYRFGRDTLHSPVLKKGQVFYVWTGKKDGSVGDLSGTYVKARNGKKIAVFQGCPHTNIPYQQKQRDHIFSQAMPTSYWGNTFVLTTSSNRPVDIIRIMALNDGTEVRINGQLVHTFDFATETKRYWEFEIGTNGTYAQNGSCLVTTSCPCAVHLFMVSQQYHGDKNSNGDPAMLWVNPIEQQIDQITFATYTSSNGTTSHYTNIVTDHPEAMLLDGASIAGDFHPVSGSSTYYYAQKSLGNTATSHTLKCTAGNFIAHVYGFTANESYGYSAGGATRPLTQYITINGQIFSADSENVLCGEDTIQFRCVPDYDFEKIVWHFGDGTPDYTTTDTAVVPHYYADSRDYFAKVYIYRASSNLCVGQSAIDSIPVKVTIGRYEFSIGSPDIPCPEDGKNYIGKIPYTSTAGIDLTGDNVIIDFDQAAKDAGFKRESLTVTPSQFIINIPNTAEASVPYGISIKIESECGGTDTVMIFQLPIGNDVIAQRYQNVLGLTKDERFDGLTLSDFQWYRTSDSTALEGQISANLNMYDIPEQDYYNDAFYVCYTINKGQTDERRTCACAKAFTENADTYQFEEGYMLTAQAITGSDRIFVNAQFDGTDEEIECTAQWITIEGKIYEQKTFQIPNGGCTIDTPKENGLYLLRVITDKQKRNFKFLINK